MMRVLLSAAVTVLGVSAALAASPKSAAPRGPASSTAKPAPPAAPTDLAFGAFQRGLYVTAHREALARIEKNPADAAAFTLLGVLYDQGLAVRRDPKAAGDWYRMAAQNGSAAAMAALGMMALEGRGGPRDEKAAQDWLEKAAARRDPGASYNLALVMLDRGGEADIARAARLLAVAAENEIAAAQHALGVMYARGIGGLPTDKAQAARLFLRASRNGSTVGEVEYAIVLFNGDGVARNEAEAARHFQHAAARGNAIAQNRLARLFVLGRGLPKNRLEALAWHTMARNQGREDPWLDEQLKDAPKAERAAAAKLAEERANL